MASADDLAHDSYIGATGDGAAGPSSAPRNSPHPVRRIYAPLARLGAVLPGPAAAARQALGEVLAPLGSAPASDSPWSGSDLTPDGFPVAFAWSSRDEAIRWVAEIAGADVAPAARIEAACGMLERLTGQPVPADSPSVPMSGRSGLRFGARIGGWHSGREDRFRLYVESSYAEGEERHCLEGLECRLSRLVAWQMRGFQPGRIDCDHYGRLGRLTLSEARRIVEWANIPVADTVGTLLSLLVQPGEGDPATIEDAAIRVALRRARPVEVTIYARSPASVSRTAAAMAQLDAAATLLGHDIRPLGALVGNRDQPLGHVGRVGVGASIAGACWLHAGWTPEATGAGRVEIPSCGDAPVDGGGIDPIPVQQEDHPCPFPSFS